MKNLFFAIFFIVIGFIIANISVSLYPQYFSKISFAEKRSVNLSYESVRSEYRNKIYNEIQKKITEILLIHKVEAKYIKVSLSSTFLSTLLEKNEFSFSLPNSNKKMLIEVEIFENSENNQINDFVFQISIFDQIAKNKVDEIVENVPKNELL